MNSQPKQRSKNSSSPNKYWSQSLRIVFFILSIWFSLSLGCGVLFRDFLDRNMPMIGGAPFGFWMAQQGAIIGFLVLLVLYMLLMNQLDRQSGYDSEDRS
jgi:putative solute:sodium symporter small subunit